MKRFADYALPIRMQALKLAASRHGIRAWDRTFDANSPQIVGICEELAYPMRHILYSALKKKKKEEAWGGKFDLLYPSKLMLELHQERYWRLQGYPRMSDIGGYMATLSDVVKIEDDVKKREGERAYFAKENVERFNNEILARLQTIEQSNPTHPRILIEIADL